MASPQLEPICVRNAHLHHILLGRRHLFEGEEARNQINKDGLIDALLVLHDECGQDPAAGRDPHITRFLDKYEPIVTRLKKLRVNANDFEQKKVIGRGHFGEVSLVREKQTGNVYAMKVMKKSATLARSNIAFYEEEKDIMAKATSEWLTSLHCSFQDSENLYLVMEFHPGGDLLSLLTRRDGTLSEEEARFYLAELVLALNSLHSMGYVHRDVKPENILLDRLGHIKLADFGSAARLDAVGVVRNEMPVGTADYIAPEVLTSLNNVGLQAGGYGRQCDFWSLGILAFELVYGYTPFADDKVTATYGNIMSHAQCLRFPEPDAAAGIPAVSADFRALVTGLLCDASRRLGYAELVGHAFFSRVDWAGLRATAPPYVPVINSLDDTSNFDDFDSDAGLAEPTLLASAAAGAAAGADSARGGATSARPGGMAGRDLPFIGFTYVKERHGAVLVAGAAASPASPTSLAAVESRLDAELKAKTKEVAELRKKLVELQNESTEWRRQQRGSDLLSQKLQRLETERDHLERQLSRALRDADNLRRGLELERTERELTQAKTVDMIQGIKRNWEKCHEKEKLELSNEIQMWKDGNATLKHRVDETDELLKSTMKAVDDLEKECALWKAKSAKYKEMATRGHRLIERRSSVLPPGAASSDLQAQLDREKRLRAEAADRCAELERRLIQSENNVAERLAEEETQWRLRAAKKEMDLRAQVDQLKNNAMNDKEKRIQDLEERLDSEAAECRQVRARAAALEKQLHESTTWRSRRETSFSAREADLDRRVVQLERDLDAANAGRLELQQRLDQASAREKDQLLNYESLVAELKLSVDKLEKRNRQLSASSGAAPAAAADKNVFLEEQVAKLEQQLEKSRESLTLEREKTRQLQSDGWKKEKELSDVRIDLRIANRELKTSQTVAEQLRDAEKAADQKLREKDEQLTTNQTLLEQVRTQLEQEQRSLASAQRRLELADAARKEKLELRDEVQRLKEEAAKLERQKASLEAEATRRDERVARYNDEKAEALAKLELLEKQTLERDDAFKQLQETCAVMDDQIQTFEGMIECNEKALKEAEEERRRALAAADGLRQELRAARQTANEEKSLKLFSESRLRDVEGRLRALEADGDARTEALKAQASEYAAVIRRLTDQVDALEQQLADAELTVAGSSRRVAILDDENAALKEECTALRTQLISVKNSNGTLGDGLEQALSKAEGFKTRIVQLEAQLETFKVMRDEREHKLESTIGQQTKLIDFLQAKTEARKKPTLSDKLFGSHKKENTPAAIPVAYRDLEVMLDKKRTQVRTLMHQLDKCRTELAAKTLEHQGAAPTVLAELGRSAQVNALATPLASRTLTRLTQSPGTQQSPGGRSAPLASAVGSGASSSSAAAASSTSSSSSSANLAVQRMHHKIPHRLSTQLTMRATNCVVCLDSIHFGRQVSVCGECRVTTHVKCAVHLPSTCGLPRGLAEHFGTVVERAEPTESAEPRRRRRPRADADVDDAAADADDAHEGWVKVPRPGKACWDSKFMKLSQGTLSLYDHEPSNDQMAPIDQLDLRPTDGTTVAIHSAVAHSEVLYTAKSDVPYIFMVELVPKTTCWPGRTLFVLAPNFPEKKAWVEALQAASHCASSASQGGRASSSERQGAAGRSAALAPLLSLDADGQSLDVNCVVTLGAGQLLIGAAEGLFACGLAGGGGRRPVRIGGVDGGVQQMALAPRLSAVLMIVGGQRQLVMTSLRVLQGCAQALQVSQPTIEVEPVAQADECHLFQVTELQRGADDVFLCAATANRVKLFKWQVVAAADQDQAHERDLLRGQFVLRKELIVSEPCSCIHFGPHSVLVGCDRFYEVDLRDFSAEEFLDASDSSLAYVVFGLKQIHSFPVAILDVTASRSEPEFLLCYHEFGVFVDGYGRRSRPTDVKWTRMPLAFAYRAPFVFVLHFNSVEVMRLTPTCFTDANRRLSGTSDASGESGGSARSAPASVFVEVPTPRYLGPAPPFAASIYLFASDAGTGAEVVRLDGAAALGVDPDDSAASASAAADSSSVYDVDTASMRSSASSASFPRSSSPLKRSTPAGVESADAKRVKFESDL